MDKMPIICCVSDNIATTEKTLLEFLFTDQLPATLTFIAALLGIITQIFISWKSSHDLRQNDARKYKLECIKDFYIHIMDDLISYSVNIKILNHEIQDFDLFNPNDSRLKPYTSNLQAVYLSIKNIAGISFEKYYPISKKLNNETISMLSYMIKASKVLDMPIDERKRICTEMQISPDGYDTKLLMELMNKYIK